MDAGSHSPEVKWPGREADHSNPSSAEARNEKSYTFTKQHAKMAYTETISPSLHSDS